MPVKGRDAVHKQFRRTGPECHQNYPHDHFVEIQMGRDGRRTFHKPLGTEVEDDKSQKYQQYIQRHVTVPIISNKQI